MRPDDLDTVERIAALVHPAYPESAAVPRERLALFAEGCFMAEDAAETAVGYAVAHPGLLGAPPALDTLLGRLPEAADCLYLHDVAMLSLARRGGFGRALLGILGAAAARHGLRHLALVAVNNSAPYWRRHGFADRVDPDGALAADLASYGGDAAYLVARL
ncbi:MAG: GNAT family N-acetyltransferase [Alphaproteobacteria bacterium]|nr:GNAT family N-acetyltransferase [Alphaproteobacteria bacterium]